MNAQLDRYIKLMAGLNGCKGIEFSPLNDLITSGNKKIPSTTAIFNMGSATDCPSRKLGFCQAINKNGKNICYARKSEYEYHPTVLPYRRRQEKYWKSCTAEQFVIDFLTLNALKALPYTALRLNEAGDFWSQKCVDKATHIARILKKYGIRVYCYTSRRDLDFSRCSKYMTISGSGFTKEGIRGIFTMVYSKKERPGRVWNMQGRLSDLSALFGWKKNSSIEALGENKVNRYKFNWLTRIILRKLCRDFVRQGHYHKARITEYYRVMRDAAEKEFTEDNKQTLDVFLLECHSEANGMN